MGEKLDKFLAGSSKPLQLASLGFGIMVVGGLAGSVVCVLLSGVAGILISVGAMLWTIVDSYFATRPGRLT